MDDSKKKKMGRPPTGLPHKKQQALKLDQTLADELAAAAYWSKRSVNGIIEEGIRDMMEKLKREHNEGKPFPPKPEN